MSGWAVDVMRGNSVSPLGGVFFVQHSLVSAISFFFVAVVFHGCQRHTRPPENWLPYAPGEEIPSSQGFPAQTRWHLSRGLCDRSRPLFVSRLGEELLPLKFGFCFYFIFILEVGLRSYRRHGASYAVAGYFQFEATCTN